MLNLNYKDKVRGEIKYMTKIKKYLLSVMILVLGVSFYHDNKTVISTSNILYENGNNNYVLNKILNDNELKEEIPHMFNYTSNGFYHELSIGMEVSDPNYITTGLYSREDDDGISYYYRGNINNNIIQFGEYTEDYYVNTDEDNYYQIKNRDSRTGSYRKVKLASKGDKMYWRIVRVNGDGSLRLIYNGTSPEEGEDIEKLRSYSIGKADFNNLSDDPKYTGYTYDNGMGSLIKEEVDAWYNNALGNTIYDDLVINSRFCNDTSGYKKDVDYGFDERNYNFFASYDRFGQAANKYIKDNDPTLKCPTTTESYGGSYRLKAGLITADELVLSGEVIMSSWGPIATSGKVSDGYLNGGTDKGSSNGYWTMTPSTFYNNYADLWQSSWTLYNQAANTNSNIRPVINVTTENKTLKGDGTANNPYILVDAVENNYKGAATIESEESININDAFEEEVDLSNVTWTSEDDSIARIENGKILGLKEGRTKITGVSSDGLTSYEIDVTVIKNPVTNSMTYIGIGLILILVLGTALFTVYRIKVIVNDD